MLEEQQQLLLENVLQLNNSNIIEQQKRLKLLRQFQIPLNISSLGFAMQQIDKSGIIKKKTDLGKLHTNQNVNQIELIGINDGIYQIGQLQKFDTMNMNRLQLRLTRDYREQFYKSNLQMVVDRQLFDDKVSRLVNLSFENNASLSIYQKNAILSERSNQKKSQPFQIQLIVGQIKLYQHPLMSQQQKKFQQIRPLLQQLIEITTHPKLAHIAKIIQTLKNKNIEMINEGASPQSLNRVKDQIHQRQQEYEKQKSKLEHNMTKILKVWNQIKQIRNETSLINVPWKVVVKQYMKDNKQQYQIGLNKINVTEKLDQLKHKQQIQRRSNIVKQRYFTRLNINNITVAQSSKIAVSWPNYCINFYQKFNMHVYTMPASVRLQIIKQGIIETVIDSISLKLPGQYANTITAAQKRYTCQKFYQNGDKVRKKKQAAAGISGIINFKIQWNGVGPKMPPSNITFAQEETTVPTQRIQEEEDANKLIDEKDPRKMKEKRKQGKKLIIPGTQKQKKQSNLPFGSLISTRQLLLKLREKNQALEKVSIPLNQQKIRKRQDLLTIIQQEKLASKTSYIQSAEKYYNPLEGIFERQPQEIKIKIKQYLNKLIKLKHITNSNSLTSYKYKLVDEIINEYSFQQMVSPVVIFFKDLFTQKRKLGPKISHNPNIRQNITQLEISVHVNSATNIPVRQTSINIISRYKKSREDLLRQLNAEQIGYISAIGAGLMGNQQPNMMGQNYPYYNNQMGTMNYGMRNQRFNIGYDNTGFNNNPAFGNNFNTGYGNTFGNNPGYGGYGSNQGFGNNQMRSNINIDYNQPPPQNIQQSLSNIQRVRTFFQIKFKKEMRRTNDTEGTSPEWNQALNFSYNLKKQNVSIQQAYYSNKYKFYIDLFDLFEESKPTKAISQLRITRTKYYLGSLDVPISTLIAMPKLAGIFKINKPLIIFGFATSSSVLIGEQDSETKLENPSIGTYVSLDFTFTPQIQPTIAYNNDRKFTTGQQNSLFLQHANDWLQQLNLKRYIRLWLNNIDGNSIFICRYLTQIQPPPFRYGEVPEKFLERTARFVSLIPHKLDCKMLDTTEQFHFKCEQFLDIKMGDDHAILLCNYFNSIDKIEGRHDIQSYLLLGKAFPEGKTMYVLRRDKKTNEYQIWNPRTGDPYSFQKVTYETVCCCFNINSGIKTIEVSKDICPLLQVGCVVSKDNVYVNIQQSTIPSDITYDLENPKFWKPFLTERSMTQFFGKKLIPVYQGNSQITKQTYELKADAKQIQHKIYEFVKERIKHDRKNHPVKPYIFQLNTDISNLIRDQLLIQLQSLKFDFRTSGIESKLYSQKQKNLWNNVLQELQQVKNRVKNKIQTDKKFYGYPINFTYTTVEDAWERISRTQTHMIQNKDVQFVLAVRAFAHPCYLTSVWIFLGTIE